MSLKKVKIIGCDINSIEMFKSFYEMAEDVIDDMSFNYKSLIFTAKDESIDFYVIIGFTTIDYYNPSKSIVLQMEPWVYDLSKNWGVKCWGVWSNPDPNTFMHVHNHKRYLNPAQWFFKIPQHINYERKNKIIAIISSKYLDSGHKNRIDFIKYVESLDYDIIDIYGYENFHNFKGYKGTVSNKNIIQNYKYMLSAENNNEHNYATEKIWEAYIAYTLCLYDGCPNLLNYVDDNSYIKVSLNNKKESLDILLNTISDNLWEKYLPNIINTRQKVIEKYNVFEVINNIILQQC